MRSGHICDAEYGTCADHKPAVELGSYGFDALVRLRRVKRYFYAQKSRNLQSLGDGDCLVALDTA